MFRVYVFKDKSTKAVHPSSLSPYPVRDTISYLTNFCGQCIALAFYPTRPSTQQYHGIIYLRSYMFHTQK